MRPRRERRARGPVAARPPPGGQATPTGSGARPTIALRRAGPSAYARPVVTGDGTRVLVVEDDDDIRSLLAELLEEEGYEVVSAADGRQGLDRAHERPPDLILLDLMMPVMNGWEFREEQRRDPVLAGVPVVVVSAAARASIDASQVLTKPFSVDDLLEAVERHAGA